MTRCLIIDVDENPGFANDTCLFQPIDVSSQLIGRIRLFSSYMYADIGKVVDGVIICDFADIYATKLEEKSSPCFNSAYVEGIGAVLLMQKGYVTADVDSHCSIIDY